MIPAAAIVAAIGVKEYLSRWAQPDVWNRIIATLHWLTLAATYTYTDARDDKGLQEIRRPPHAASGSATVLFDEGRGKATVNVIYNGRMTDTIFTFFGSRSVRRVGVNSAQPPIIAQP